MVKKNTYSKISILVDIYNDHPLFILKKIIEDAKIIENISNLRKVDNRGVRIDIRHHILVFILQLYYRCTFRELVLKIKSDAYVRYFIDFSNEDLPRSHSRYIEFQHSLSSEILFEINTIIIKHAMMLKLTEGKSIIIDSTIQEANITYPTDGKNLKKLLMIFIKIIDFIIATGENGIDRRKIKALKELLKNNKYKIIYKLLKGYFFEANVSIKKNLLQNILNSIKNLFFKAWPIVTDLLVELDIKKWNIIKSYELLYKNAEIYFNQVQIFIDTGKACDGKILSFFQEELCCIIRKKDQGNKIFFGKIWQVIRLENNFMIGFYDKENNHFHDASSFKSIFEKLIPDLGIFPDVIGADAGYSSEENRKIMNEMDVQLQGVRPKGNKKHLIEDINKREEVYNKRAGIEPLIFHLKKLGLSYSRAKNDLGTMIEGFKSFISFNLRKLISLQL